MQNNNSTKEESCPQETYIDKNGLRFRGYLKQGMWIMEITKNLEQHETVEENKERITQALDVLKRVNFEIKAMDDYTRKINHYWADSDRTDSHDIELKDRSVYQLLLDLRDGNEKRYSQ